MIETDGTATGNCVNVFEKSKNNSEELFANASNEFAWVEDRNKFSPNTLKAFDELIEQCYFATLLDNSATSESSYIFSAYCYLEVKDLREIISIIELSTCVEKIVALQAELRGLTGEIVAKLEGLEQCGSLAS